ncbi:MAG: M56 family metallopeptidase [bacterium]|nr:M56 family metallopeptidase [bacterium]
MLKFIFFTVLLMSAAGICASVLILVFSRFFGAKLTYSARYYLGAAAVAVMLVPVLPVNQLTKTAELPVQIDAEQQVKPAQRQNNTVQQTDEAEQDTKDAEAQTQPESAENEASGSAAVERDTELSSTNYENKRLDELFREFESSAFPIRASKKELYIAVLGVLWIFGAAVAAARYIIGAVWFRTKIFCFSHPAPREKQELIDELRREFKIRRRIRLRVFMGDMSPFITGIFRNTVYIPKSADEEALRLVLRHELTHCKRFDLLYKGLTELAVILHFYNPFAYILKRYVNKYCELSCDELAVEGMDFEDRKRYTMAMLTMIKKSRYRLHGAAALGEKKSNLRERVEFIMMNKKYSKQTKILSRALIAAVLAVSTLFGGLAQANNSAEPPKATYTSKSGSTSIFCNDKFELNGNTYNFSLYGTDASGIFTDILGYTRLYASFMAEPVSTITEEQEFLKANGEEAWHNREYTKPSATDFYEITLQSVTARGGYLTGSLEGTAEIKKNGNVLADNYPIYVNNLPGTGEFKYQTYNTIIYVPNIEVDGVSLELNVYLRFEDITPDDRIAYESVRYNFERSRSTKELYLSERVEAEVNGVKYTENTYYNAASVSFNEKSQNAEMDFSFFSEDGNYSGYLLYLSPYRQASVKGDSVKADFQVKLRTGEINNSEEKYEVKPFTITGLDGGEGDFVELRSDDGTMYAKYRIGTKPKEKTHLKGTKDVSEFIVEGEDYFVGTPAEQEDFDRDDHDRLYKRIVVDDEGKVIFVIPIENQSSDTLHEAEDMLNNDDYSDGYVQVGSYEGMADRLLSDEDMQVTVKIDDLTWWATAILTRDNLFAQETETDNVFIIGD